SSTYSPAAQSVAASQTVSPPYTQPAQSTSPPAAYVSPPQAGSQSTSPYYSQSSSSTYGTSTPPQTAAPYGQSTQSTQNRPAVTSYGQAQQVASSASTTVQQPQSPVPVLANTSLRVIGTGFSAPTGLAFDRLGNLYVANYTTNTLDRISVDGTRTQFSS